LSAAADFPGLRDLQRVVHVWPRIFAEQQIGLLPVALEEQRLLVLCVGDAALAMVAGNAAQILRLLNRLLDGDVVIDELEAVAATRTELFLARDLLALKSWLVDFDVGI